MIGGLYSPIRRQFLARMATNALGPILLCIVRGFPDIVFLQLQDERECVFVLWKSLSVCLFVILKSVCACVRARARVCRNLYVCGVCVL